MDPFAVQAATNLIITFAKSMKMLISFQQKQVWYNDISLLFISHKDDDFRYSFVDYVSSSNYPFTYPNINDEVTLITNLRSYKAFLGI